MHNTTSCLCSSCSLRRVAPYMPSDPSSVRACWALWIAGSVVFAAGFWWLCGCP